MECLPEALGNNRYHTEDSIKIFCDLITYILQHVAGTKKVKKMGSNYRGSAEFMSYTQAITASDDIF